MTAVRSAAEKVFGQVVLREVQGIENSAHVRTYVRTYIDTNKTNRKDI